PQPWLGRLLSVEKGRVKIHWYRQRKAIETKLDGTFWPLYQEDNAKAPDCGYVQIPNEIFLDWDFELVQQQHTGWKIPMDRVESINRGFQSFQAASTSKRGKKKQAPKKKDGKRKTTKR